MCAHPQAVIAYSAVKRSLAAAIADLDTYAEVKDPIVDLVIVTAEEWAVETGWSTSTEGASGRSSGHKRGRWRPTADIHQAVEPGRSVQVEAHLLVRS